MKEGSGGGGCENISVHGGVGGGQKVIERSANKPPVCVCVETTLSLSLSQIALVQSNGMSKNYKMLHESTACKKPISAT